MGALSLQHECVFAAIHFKPFSLRSWVCMLDMLFALDGPHGNVHVSSARWLAEWPVEGLAEWPEAGDVESPAEGGVEKVLGCRVAGPKPSC